MNCPPQNNSDLAQVSDMAVWCVLDIETAEERRGSICEIAVVWYGENSEQLAEHSELVRLPEGYSFHQHNIQRHGITEEETKDCRNIKEIMTELSPLLSGIRILAHNSNFEKEHLEALKLPYPDISLPEESQWIDTLRISRYAYFPFTEHRLNNIVSRYGIAFDATQAHRALYDAKILGEWFKMFVKLHYRGDVAKAIEDYDRRPAHVGSYVWFRSLTRNSYFPSYKQRKYITKLVSQRWLSIADIRSTPFTKRDYSKLIGRVKKMQSEYGHY